MFEMVSEKRQCVQLYNGLEEHFSSWAGVSEREFMDNFGVGTQPKLLLYHYTCFYV